MRNQIFILLALMAPLFGQAAPVPLEVPVELKSALPTFITGDVVTFEDDNNRGNPAWDVTVKTAEEETVRLTIMKNDKQMVRAEGKILNGKNSAFTPGNGVKNPNELRTFLGRFNAFRPSSWILRKTPTGWVYYVMGFEQGFEKEYRVEAKLLTLMSVNAE